VPARNQVSLQENFVQQLNQWNVILNRSLKYRWPYYELTDKKRLIILKRLAAGGFFKNNCQMIVEISWRWPSISRFYQVLPSMAHLEKLSLLNWKLRLTQDVPKLFQSCPKLSELHLKLDEGLEIDEELKNELRSGFQRIRLLELHWDISAWPVIQELFT
jgi:hypothetical protein